MSEEERLAERVISVQLVAKVIDPVSAITFEERVRISAQELFGQDWTLQVRISSVYADAEVGLMLQEEAHANSQTHHLGGDPEFGSGPQA